MRPSKDLSPRNVLHYVWSNLFSHFWFFFRHRLVDLELKVLRQASTRSGNSDTQVSQIVQVARASCCTVVIFPSHRSGKIVWLCHECNFSRLFHKFVLFTNFCSRFLPSRLSSFQYNSVNNGFALGSWKSNHQKVIRWWASPSYLATISFENWE